MPTWSRRPGSSPSELKRGLSALAQHLQDGRQAKEIERQVERQVHDLGHIGEEIFKFGSICYAKADGSFITTSTCSRLVVVPRKRPGLKLDF